MLKAKEDNHKYSEQLWRCNHRFVVWITFNLDSQKKSGFRSFAYSILFNFQVSFVLPFCSQAFVWVALGDSFVIISCRFRFVKYFFEVFLKKFFSGSCRFLPNFSANSKKFLSYLWRLIQFSRFVVVVSTWCLTRQLNYNIILQNVCQHYF